MRGLVRILQSPGAFFSLLEVAGPERIESTICLCAPDNGGNEDQEGEWLYLAQP